MDIKLNIDPEAIEQQVTNAILKSAIGEQIKKAVDASLAVDSGYRKSLVQRAVEDVLLTQIRNIAMDVLDDKKEEIRARILEKLTDETIEKLTRIMWDETMKKFEER